MTTSSLLGNSAPGRNCPRHLGCKGTRARQRTGGPPPGWQTERVRCLSLLAERTKEEGPHVPPGLCHHKGCAILAQLPLFVKSSALLPAGVQFSSGASLYASSRLHSAGDQLSRFARTPVQYLLAGLGLGGRAAHNPAAPQAWRAGAAADASKRRATSGRREEHGPAARFLLARGKQSGYNESPWKGEVPN